MDNPLALEAVTSTAKSVSQRVSDSFAASGKSLNSLANDSGIARTTLRRKLDGHAEFTASELLILEHHLPGRFIDWLQDLLRHDEPASARRPIEADVA